jgi:hypothetical protein
MEFTKFFPVETSPKIGYQDLSTLVESDPSSVEDHFVAETREALGQ